MRLELNAHLQAYSRAPFYNDWVRDVAKEEYVTSNDVWVRKFNEETKQFVWYKIDGSFLTDEGLQGISENLTFIENNLNNFKEDTSKRLSDIYVQFFPYIENVGVPGIIFYNKNGWNVNTLESDGETITTESKTEITIPFPRALTDNNTIFSDSNDSGKLKSTIIPDNETIRKVHTGNGYGVDLGSGEPKIVEKYQMQAIALAYKAQLDSEDYDQIISGNDIKSTLDSHQLSIDNISDKLNNPIIHVEAMPRIIGEGNLIDELTKYVKAELNLVSEESTIPNNVEVLYPRESLRQEQDLFIYNKNTGWEYHGKKFIIEATNNSLGIVKGSSENYKVSVSPDDATMSINGLEDALNNKINIGENTSGYSQIYSQNIQGEIEKIIVNDHLIEGDNATIVKRTLTGQIKCTDPEEDQDAINKGWLGSNLMDEEDIDNMLTDIFDALSSDISVGE